MTTTISNPTAIGAIHIRNCYWNFIVIIIVVIVVPQPSSALVYTKLCCLTTAGKINNNVLIVSFITIFAIASAAAVQ